MTEPEILTLFRQTDSPLDWRFVLETFEPGKLLPDLAAAPGIKPGGK